MKQRTFLVLSLTAAILGGCAGGPQSSGITTSSILPSLPAAGTSVPFFGRSTASSTGQPERVSGNLYRLPPADLRGGDAITRENYDMVRAAEATLALGGTHFVMVNLSGPRSLGPFAGGDVTAGGVMMRVLRVEAATEAPVGALAASHVLASFGQQFDRAPAGLPDNPAFPSEPAAPAGGSGPPALRGT